MSKLYRYLTTVPKPADKNYKKFWEEEEKKVLEGVNIDGFQFSGWLYWHINHWVINMDDLLPNGEIVSKPGNPLLRDNELLINEALLKAEDHENPNTQERKRKGLVILGLRQMGKDLANSCKLYTDTGPITIGDCKVGDKIFDESGNKTTIIGKYPQGVKPIYTLRLLDGRVIECGLEHNWYVWDRVNKKYFVKTTEELIKNYRSYRNSWKARSNPYEYRYYIDTAEPIKHSIKDTRIVPYILGLWLGDGHSATSGFTNTDAAIIDYIYEYASNHNLKVRKSGISYFLSAKNKSYKNELLENLKFYDLLNNKHIPDIYLRNHEVLRFELLRGLMDSDGWCDKDGTIGFTTTNVTLADNFEELCRGLGVVVTRSIKYPTCIYKGEISYGMAAHTFNIFTDYPIFKLSRKLGNMGRSKKRYKDRVPIVSIEYKYSGETTCIEVDNKSHLFLTDGYTITHNTTFESSYSGRSGVIFKGSQNLILGTTLGDLNNITQNIDFGLLNCTPWFRTPRITRDWDSERVQLGFKDKKGDNQIWSQYVIRNTAGGKKTEAGAGTTIKSVVYDEIGKDDFIQAFIAIKPAMVGRFGYRAVPILVGTGGSFEKGEDAKNLFFKPSAHNMVEFTQSDGRVTGLFMPGTLRQDCKYSTTLGHWLLETGRLKHIPEGSELFSIPIEATDEALALKTILAERDAALLDPDPKAWLKQVMYYPLTPEEVFLTDTNNSFPIQAIERHIADLKENYKPQCVELYREPDGSVTWRFSEKRIISQFPIDRTTITDAPVVIYEEPIKGLPYATYVCGIDPYNQDVASGTSPSLGSVYIFKRMYDALGNFQNSIVASYTGRPKTLKEFYEICEMIIDMYNAVALPENEGSIIQYFIQKHKEHVLFDSPALTRYINPTSSTQSRQKGLAATTPNQKHYMKLMVEYTIEEMINEAEKSIQANLGVRRIPDLMLLEEMKQYRGKNSNTQRGVHDGNFDRICAFGHCLTLANYLDRDYPIFGFRQKEEQVKRANIPFSPFPLHERDDSNPHIISPFSIQKIYRSF